MFSGKILSAPSTQQDAQIYSYSTVVVFSQPINISPALLAFVTYSWPQVLYQTVPVSICLLSFWALLLQAQIASYQLLSSSILVRLHAPKMIVIAVMHFNPHVTVLYGCLLDFVGWRKRTVSFDSDVVGNEGLPEICILYIAFQTTEDKSFIVQAGPPGFCLKMLEPTELNCTSQCPAQTISKCRWGGAICAVCPTRFMPMS